MRRIRRTLPLVLLVAACTPSQKPGAPPPAAVALPVVIQGANLRPVEDERRGYGTKTARLTMQRLRKLGVNTISVLMEGRMRAVDDPRIQTPDRDEIDAVHQALLDANEMGFATVLVPHIYIADGTWRGRIELGDDELREDWWASYETFIGQAAGVAAATGTSMLSIGVELRALSAQPDTNRRMRRLAANVRRDYAGALTYHANWDEAESVAFWEAVDFAGVNGYYPLLPDPIRGAEINARRLTTLSRIAERPVVVLEVGYRSSPLSHVKPWAWPDEVEPLVDHPSQARAWAAVLTHWLHAEGVRGLLVWVVPTDPDDPASEPAHGFNPLNKPAEQVIGRVFSNE
ncbi:MAG: hypothetical protein RMA76_31700 [Deltaproteobacteria bacterium]